MNQDALAYRILVGEKAYQRISQPPPADAATRATAFFLHGRGEIRLGGLEGRRHSEQQTGEDGDDRREEQHARVHWFVKRGAGQRSAQGTWTPLAS